MRILFLAILLSLSMPFFVQSWAGEGVPLKNGITTAHELNPFELNELAVRYVTGDGVEKDYDQARFLWLKAAGHGHAGAQFNLGLMYESGTGVQQDSVKAFTFYREAALNGLAEAQNSFGRLYEMGQGVEQNITEAKKWYRLAALQGYVLAQSNLGFQLYAGKNNEGDMIEAFAWLSLAAKQNNAIAQAHLRELTGMMTRRQIEVGQRMAYTLNSDISTHGKQ